MTKQQQKSLPVNNLNVDGGSNNIDSSIGIDNVDKLNWNELRKTIKTYGLSNSGRKIELQQRLKNYLVEQQQQQENKLHGLSTTINEIKEESEEQVVVLPAAVLTTPTPISAAVVKPTPEQRSRMEQNRKRALQLRQQFFRDGQKRLKGASSEKLLSTTDASAVAAKPITPVASAVVIKNPYKKNPRSTVAATPVQQKPATLPQHTFTSPLFHLPSSSSPPPPPPVISTWGDCRMDLWETVCRCGGAREHSPDVRMCRCGAALDAGLVCGCRRGVLLIKSGPRGFFWGCSLYRKEGCKYTKRFGPPYDREAGIQLAHLRQSAMRKRDREIEEWSC